MNTIKIKQIEQEKKELQKAKLFINLSKVNNVFYVGAVSSVALSTLKSTIDLLQQYFSNQSLNYSVWPMFSARTIVPLSLGFPSADAVLEGVRYLLAQYASSQNTISLSGLMMSCSYMISLCSLGIVTAIRNQKKWNLSQQNTEPLKDLIELREMLVQEYLDKRSMFENPSPETNRVDEEILNLMMDEMNQKAVVRTLQKKN